MVTDAIASNWIAPLGPHVDAFENEMRARLGVPHALALSSGTAALHLALLVAGVQAGDHVWCSANGAQCYNCHQINKAEISYGTIGPSLWNYGKLRGVKDVADPASAAIVQYTWGKLWNSKAYAACSNMPRFGHMKLLNEEQLRHVMALLLDPKSPVNQ